MLGGLHRMGLQAVLADSVCIGMRRLHRHHPRRPHLYRLFHDEIRARLLDRRKQQPQVGRGLQGPRLRLAGQHAAMLAGHGHLGPPFAILPVEQQNRRARPQPHHVEQVMRLVPRQGHGLPRRKGLLYIKPDLRILHWPNL